jgi:hypothetical protein
MIPIWHHGLDSSTTLSCIHIHVKKTELYCGGHTNMKCFDCLPTYSHNLVELMAIKKNISLTHIIVGFCSYNLHIKCNQN